MRLRRFALTLPVLVLLGACRGGDIPVVGYDAEGKTIETLMPKRKYIGRLTKSVEDMSQSVVPIVDGQAYGRKLSGLRGLRLGLGVKGSVGLGDYWKIGGNIGFHLHFANKN